MSDFVFPYTTTAEEKLLDMGLELGTFFTHPAHSVEYFTGTEARPVRHIARHYRTIVELPGIGVLVFDCDAQTDQAVPCSFGGSTPGAVRIARQLQAELAA